MVMGKTEGLVSRCRLSIAKFVSREVFLLYDFLFGSRVISEKEQFSNRSGYILCLLACEKNLNASLRLGYSAKV
jgi:hypothetical protein